MSYFGLAWLAMWAAFYLGAALGVWAERRKPGKPKMRGAAVIGFAIGVVVLIFILADHITWK